MDIGVGFPLIPRNEFNKLQIREPLQPSKIAFRSYTKNIIIPDGKSNVKVEYNNFTTSEDLYVNQVHTMLLWDDHGYAI